MPFTVTQASSVIITVITIPR